MFHEYGFLVVFLPLSVIEHGPSSNKRPVDELHPGPPFSHIVSGASLGDVRDSKNLRKFNVSPSSQSIGYTNQKKRCLSSAMSRYPEYCFTDGSQSLGSVTRKR